MNTFTKLLASDNNYHYYYSFNSFVDKLNSLSIIVATKERINIIYKHKFIFNG